MSTKNAGYWIEKLGLQTQTPHLKLKFGVWVIGKETNTIRG
jgi:hypothetical protein